MDVNFGSVNSPDILIVDDTPDNIRLLSSFLTQKGYSVRKALSGYMALVAVKTVAPALILLDVTMPEMDGYEVCKHLKDDPETAHIPIIFVSALGEAWDKVKAFNVGGADYITKPFHPEEVLVRVEHQLTIRALQIQLEQQNLVLKDTIERLKHTQTQLVQKEKMAGVGQLAAGICHEINNPITFIYNNLSPARNYINELIELLNLYQQECVQPSTALQAKVQDIDLDFISSDLFKILDSFEYGTSRIRSVTLALRIFTRLGESDIKAVDIHEGLDSTLLLLQHRLQGSENTPAIQVHRNYADLPSVMCYAGMLNQVFLHILNNAIDALLSGVGNRLLPTDQPTITVFTEHIDPKHVAIRIKDNGVGMSEEVRSHIFEPFFTTKPVGEGAGLGLSVSYQIVTENHQGVLTCISSPGYGAEFVIQIPIEITHKRLL